MPLTDEAKLLRIFIGESDRWQGKPLYEAIVLEARRRGLAGATVLKGTMGFGHSSRVHTAKVLRLSEDLPMVVEIVDRPERIDGFLPGLQEMIGDGLVTIESVKVLRYGTTEPKA
jgi:PII-like signaling protein